MSYTRLLSLFLICFSLMLGSCSKDDSTSPGDTNNQNTSKNSLSVKVDGVAWNFTSITAGEMPHLDRIAIVAANVTNGVSVNNLNLTIAKNIQAGTYTMSSGVNTVTYSEGSEAWMIGFGGKGTLVITKSTADEIEGTFSATLYSYPYTTDSPKKEITEGKFHLNVKDIAKP